MTSQSTVRFALAAVEGVAALGLAVMCVLLAQGGDGLSLAIAVGFGIGSLTFARDLWRRFRRSAE